MINVNKNEILISPKDFLDDSSWSALPHCAWVQVQLACLSPHTKRVLPELNYDLNDAPSHHLVNPGGGDKT